MNIHDWHRNGLMPAFATVEQWINDQLGYVGAEDEACYAVEVRSDRSSAGLALRIIVATDKGLFDMLWERPQDPAGRRLTSRHYRWSDVRGLHLVSETGLDPQTLIHTEPHWRLEIADPEVTLDQSDEGTALIELWSACYDAMKKAGG